MAEPITNIKRMEITKEDIEKKNIGDVVEAVSENKEAILKGIDLLASLNNAEMLETATALINNRKFAMEKAINEINKDLYAGTLDNLSKLFLLAGEVDTDQLQYFLRKLNNGLDNAQNMDSEDNTSYMGIFKALKDPEINRSITMLLELLRGMGKEE